jgi:aquaporin Z
MAESSMPSKLIAEFTGTFLLIFTIGCNVLGKTGTWTPVSIACVLMVVIYTFGGISGANFNPAVSVTLGINKALGHKNGLEWKDVGIYSGVQILAGIIAGFCYFALFGHAFNLAPAKGFGIGSAGACELLYTFMLCFVVLNVAASKDNDRSGDEKPEAGNHYYGLAIGFVIVAGAYGAGAISGGCFNPAVALGIDVSSAHLGIGYSLAYIPFELLGAALAAGLFKVVRPEEFGGEKSLVSELTSEFIGTFMLVLTVGLNVLGKSPAGAYSIAASLMCMIYALGSVSGAHFNPAVTLAIFCSKLCPELTASKMGAYMVTQILGGIAAGATYSGIYYGKAFPLGAQKGYDYGQVAVAEIAFTFVLCLVVLCVAVSKKTATKDAFGLAIGSCVTVGGLAIGGISGGSLNPAVSFGIAAAYLPHGSSIVAASIYAVFEFIGAAAAAGVVMVTHADAGVEEKKTEDAPLTNEAGTA